MKSYAVIGLAVILISAQSFGQCPTLGQNATFTSADCLPGSNPCALCPGDMYTLTPTGSNLSPGDCINWYISDMPNFNPYNGEGTLLGCSALSSPPPDPCNPNPTFLGIFVNACGTEENNEFLGLWSGGGFNTGDLVVSYDDPANNGCGWQSPNPALEAAIGAECPGAVFVGSGEDIPANVIVVVFSSSDADFDYNFSGLCATNGTFYVLQSDCSHATDVFPNTGTGTVSTNVSIGCWSEDITYDLTQIANTNGAFVAEIPIIGTFYGQAGCSWPSFPGLPGGDPVVNIAPLEVTVTPDQCNTGPSYIVGIYDPLPSGCPPTFTNYLEYEVLCPSPVLGTTDLCSSVTNYNLIQIQDPAVPAGTWSGSGVSGSTFNAAGLDGPIQLTFTPASPCGTPATTVINVSTAPTATFQPVPSVCTGGATVLTIDFTGTPTWNFNILANGVPLNNFTAGETPFDITINPVANTNYSLQNLVDGAGCSGPNSSVIAMVSNSAPSATLTLLGNDTICSGSATSFSVDFSGGTPPYDFEYAINGTPQAPQTNISQDPYVFPVTINNNSDITLISVTDDNGCTGTVSGSALIRTLPAPVATLVSDTVTICAGLTDTLTIQLSGTAPFTFVYRLNNVNQAPITTNLSTYKIVVSPPSGPAVYTLFSVSDSICTGAVSGIYRIEVIPMPTAVLSGMDTICAGQPATISIDFTGTPPYTVDYTANNIAQPTIVTNNNPHVISVNPAVTTTYALTALNAGACPGMVSGTAQVLVPPVPTAVISGGGQICQGGTGTTVTVTFTGTAPFTFEYSINNVVQMPAITTMSNTYTFNVNPGIGTAYRLVSFHDAICSGTFSGIAQIFVFVPASATLSGSAVFCDSADTNVMVDFNGSGPFTIEYTVNGVLQPPVFTSDDPYFIPVDVSSTTTYVLTNVESPGCTGIPMGSATITVNYPPSYANLSLNCNALLNNYTVSFTVLNATLPLTLVSGSGTFSGNQFTSNAISQGSGYNFQFNDANNCGLITVSGPSTCNCTTAAGSMNLTPIAVCQSQIATAPYNGGLVNDGNDLLMYILHTNPALPLGTILNWSSTPSFGFQTGMALGTTYYISAIAGNPNGLGQVELSDPCLSVSQGTPVSFYVLPTADIGVSSDTICLGDSLIINVSLTGTPNFSINTQIGGAAGVVNGISGGSYSLVVYPTQNVVVTLNNVQDQHCPSGTVSGMVDITVVPPPAFGQEQVVCDYNTGTYTVSFAVSGTPPFNITGLPAGFNGTVFTSLPIPFGTPYLAYLTDNNNCGADTLSGLGVCGCLSDAGMMSQAPVNACQEDTIHVPVTMLSTLEPGDTLMYIFHSSAGNTPGTIFAWSPTPDFTFGGAMAPNTTYYVSAIVGNPDGMGQVDLLDPCLSVATGTPVLWYPVPTAMVMDSTYNICPGQNVMALITLSGSPVYTLTYTRNGNVFTGFPQQNFFSFTGNNFQTSEIMILTGVIDGNGCVGVVDGQLNINVHPTPVVVNFNPVCDLNAQTYTLEFDVINADTASVMVSNITGTYDIVTGRFVSDPYPVTQPYAFTVTDSWGCGNFIASGMVDCACVTDAGSLAMGNLVLCAGQTASVQPATGVVLGAGDTLLYFLVSTPSPTTWTVLGTSSTPDFMFNPTTMTYETTYYIVAAAGSIVVGGINLNDPCFSSAPGASVLWRTPVTATLTGMDTICIGNSATLQIAFTGEGPYFFTYTDGGINQVVSNISQNPYNLVVMPAVSSNYALVGISGAGTCVGTVSGTANIQVNQAPLAVNVVETCDFTTETYILSFDISNGVASNSNYSISGLAGSISDTTFTSLPNPGAQAYQITISDDAGCSTTINGQPACVCISSAGTLSNLQDACLPSGMVSAQSNGNSSLDADDALRYILCTDPALLPAGILAESTTPQFAFLPGMTAETTYFIVVAVGNLSNGSFDFNDPCHSLSTGFPVVFHDLPTATISGLTTVCPGGNAAFNIQFNGTAPFNFVYAINGVQQPPLTSPVKNFGILSNNVDIDQTFTLISLQDAHCVGTVSGQATLTLLPRPTAVLSGTSSICVGDTAMLNLSLSGAAFYQVTISGGSSPINLTAVQQDTVIAVSPINNTTYTITGLVGTGNTCAPDIGPGVTITTDRVNATATLSNFNGYNVSCPNGIDGSITLNPQTGAGPVTANWSDGNNSIGRTDLVAGDYEVTLTNQIGCTLTQSFSLIAPPEIGIGFETTSPTCFGDENGSVFINAINGGAGPFNLLINNRSQGIIDTFPVVIDQLSSGDYIIGIEDANGCISDDTAMVSEPEQLMVNLGPDTLISFGDSLRLLVIHNAPMVDTFTWSPTNYLATPDQLETWAKPPTSQVYSIYLRDNSGCEATDDIVIQVQKDRRVYIPNVMNPLSTQFNDVATVYGGAEVAKVRYMRIFDRWGEMVFENNDFQHNDEQQGWDGKFKGEYVNPAVYVYVVEVEYIDGETEIFKGDITVVR